MVCYAIDVNKLSEPGSDLGPKVRRQRKKERRVRHATAWTMSACTHRIDRIKGKPITKAANLSLTKGSTGSRLRPSTVARTKSESVFSKAVDLFRLD